MLITGGSGLLGGELKKVFPKAFFPERRDFDVTNIDQMEKYLGQGPPFPIFHNDEAPTLIHAAAFTSPPKVEKNPEEALNSNIAGTVNVVRLCMRYDIKLVYICTDYVFSGKQGTYREDDEVYPPNKYAWSKLGGECAVRLHNNSLIIRTSFGGDTFPFAKAYTDQWTSRITAAEFSKNLLSIVEKGTVGVLHIGQPRLSVYEWAKKISPDKDIGKLSRDEVDFPIPRDTSLDISKMERILNE